MIYEKLPEMGKPEQTPIWEIRNSEKAMEAVQQTDDQHILAEVVKKSRYIFEVRAAALAKIQDQDILERLIEYVEKDADLYRHVEEIVLPLAEKLANRDLARSMLRYILSINGSKMRQVIINVLRIFGEHEILGFACNKHFQYREEAAGLITNMDALVEYIQGQRYLDTSRVPWNIIKDRSLLLKIIGSTISDNIKHEACRRLDGHDRDKNRICRRCGQKHDSNSMDGKSIG